MSKAASVQKRLRSIATNIVREHKHQITGEYGFTGVDELLFYLKQLQFDDYLAGGCIRGKKTSEEIGRWIEELEAADKSNSRACDGCSFVKAQGVGPGALGECRRNPPVMIYRNQFGIDEMGFWPVVDLQAGWCGEFKPKFGDALPHRWGVEVSE